MNITQNQTASAALGNTLDASLFTTDSDRAAWKQAALDAEQRRQDYVADAQQTARHDADIQAQEHANNL